MHPEPSLAVAATFTAEPLNDPLRFWLSEAQLGVAPTFAPFDQLHQQLLDPASVFAQNAGGVNVLLVRFEDWSRTGGEGHVEERFTSLESALRSYDLNAPLLVIRCPDAPEREADAGGPSRERERRLIDACDPRRGAHAVRAEELLRQCGGAYSSPHGERLGQVPYTEAFFAALAAVTVRTAAALQPSPYKVIAVDCDGTLWSGVCAEVGPYMVELTPEYLSVQRFLVEQVERGRIVCLCSKNEPRDVWEVFRYRAGMPVTRSRVAAARINWDPKSSNLRALADELNVGLDSFIFIDDNPAERAEVRAHAPEVLTLDLPEDPAARPAFLAGTWAFDQLFTTDYDRNRGAFYLEEGLRREAREGTESFGDFLEGLGLEVEVRDLTEATLERVAQLTQRTNQFNTTGLRLSPQELSAWAAQDGRRVRTVHARDRFGDYGLIGVVLGEEREDTLHVAGLMLSCRALGRGVEYRVLNVLGADAEARGESDVEFAFAPLPRNAPARRFLDTVAVPQPSGSYFVSAVEAKGREYRPDEMEGVAPPAADRGHADRGHADRGHETNGGTAPVDRTAETLRLARLAAFWQDPEKVRAQMHRRRPSSLGAREPARTPTEEALCAVWGEVLGIDEVGRADDFFALGGDSLKGTIMLARLEASLGVALPLSDLFEHRSVAALADRTVRARLAAMPPEELNRLIRELTPEEERHTSSETADR